MNLKKILCSLSIVASLAFSSFAYAETMGFDYDIRVIKPFLDEVPANSFDVAAGSVLANEGLVQFVFFSHFTNKLETSLIVGVNDILIERISVDPLKVIKAGNSITYVTKIGNFDFNEARSANTLQTNDTFDLVVRHWFK